MTARRRLAVIVCTLLALASRTASAGTATPPALDARSAAELSAALGTQVEVSRDPATGAVRHLRVAGRDRTGDLAPGKGPVERRARAFLASHGRLFGIRNAAAELRLQKEETDLAGFRHVSHVQVHRGVSVFAAVLRTHFDRESRLRAANGTFLPGLEVDPQPRISPATAVERAVAFVSGRRGVPAALARGTEPELLIYRTHLGKGVRGSDHLTWSVTAAAGGNVDRVFVDAHRGKVVDALPLRMDALDRRAFPGADDDGDQWPDSWPSAPGWTEGDALPSGDPERDAMLLATGDFHARLLAGFGRDSWDSAGRTLDVVHEFVHGCPNAAALPLAGFVEACPGLATHDVMAHEWAHFLTYATNGLIYRWQSGALNESFSDVWGEALDQLTQLPATSVDLDDPAPPRSDGTCSSMAPPPTALTVLSPTFLAGPQPSAAAFYGPTVTITISGSLAPALDGAGPDPNDGCEPLLEELTAGTVVLANRGNCPDHVKTLHAQEAGAAAAILGNTAASPYPELWIAPWCGDPLDVECVSAAYAIPTVGVPLSVADPLRRHLARGVSLSLAPVPPGRPTEASIRWLLGEDIPYALFQRDMWTPSCGGAPDRVGDTAWYFCGTFDNGGVHINSGVPNHAFSLLVDGGRFNGIDVAAVGMVKAMHLFYRAHTVYLVPASGFADFADALEASCADLAATSTVLADPWGGPPVVLAESDCGAVAAAVAAVELRRPPTFCGFETVLSANPPPLCPNGEPRALAHFGWESGPAGWTSSRRDVASPEAFQARDWTIEATGSARGYSPAFHAGDAPDLANCYASLDQTGVLVLESPTFQTPATGPPLELAFDHLVGSEGDWDGGNLKVSVEGGPYRPLPRAAYAHNPPTGPLFGTADGNTNPLAGEPAWHGTDAGSNGGSWGRTMARLQSVVPPGRTFRLRFELGTDYCFGTGVGWWLDDVRLYTCSK